MGAKYPIMSPQEVIKKLEKIGFVFRSQKGSHAKYVKTNGTKLTTIIPMHSELSRYTLKSILEQCCLELDEFLEI